MTEHGTGGDQNCPVCGHTAILDILDLPAIPVYCNVLWATSEAAQAAPTGDLLLGFCQQCGHVFNQLFDPALVDYTAEYENSLHYSPRFQQYAETLAATIVEQFDLHGKNIVEIACGKGDFLRMLCRLGNNHGVGFDPSYDAERGDQSAGEQVKFVTEYYDTRQADYPADLVCCRHALEHIPSPTDFLAELRRTVGKRHLIRLFFEVPNSLYSLRDRGVWDFIYEHPSYFCAQSLQYCFELAGFTVDGVREEFGGQFLCLDALPNKRWQPEKWVVESSIDIRQLTEYAHSLKREFEVQVEQWQRHLAEADDAGRSLVLWGGGSKGVSFLNLLRPGDQVVGIVDINPHKQGKFVAGTGHRVLAPSELVEIAPDEVVVMNPLYTDEIAATLNDLSVAADVSGV